ncbi:MAG: G1 family glutamic endopeptidase, partial [Pseudonocardiaceae bacterium]
GFDPLTASKTDLARHGLPQRPDPRTQPGLAALWEQRAPRYQGFEHLEPKFLPADKPTEPAAAGFGLDHLTSCGFELTSFDAPITMVSGTWTVPNLNHSPTAGLPNDFRTFFGLGFLDVHVEMTVDTSQNVTALIRIHTGAQVALPVNPGDAISATLCLDTDDGTACYGLANETTSQTVNFAIETGFPPAVAINAGISRGSQFNGPPDPLARFGVVYFDEVLAFSTNGTKLLTDGVPTTMVDFNGSTLAIPQRLNDFAFKAVYRGD